ncbi:MAG: hypothetical protein HY900_22005 [Deltaproteobacteria bacterium]|nr:hypothetical protein [Deltaproteobacteria bacterium]
MKAKPRYSQADFGFGTTDQTDRPGDSDKKTSPGEGDRRPFERPERRPEPDGRKPQEPHPESRREKRLLLAQLKKELRELQALLDSEP